MKQNYKVTLTTLSPVFIGNGNTIGKKEYLYDNLNEQIIVFNRNKLLTGLMQMKLLDAYCNEALKPEFKLKFFLQKNNIRPAQYKEWISHCLDSSAVIDGRHALKNISCFVKDAYGVPYIPGSSLKGALRTAILSSEISNIDLKNEKIELLQTNKYKDKRDLKNKADKIEVKAFNTLGRKNDKKNNAVNDIFSKMLISDSEPIENCKLILCEKFDVALEGSAKPVSSVVRECLPPNTKINFTMSIEPECFNIENIKGCIAKRFESYYKNYLDYFHCDDIDDIITENNIVIGGGTGFQSKTITYELLGKKDGLDFTKKFMCENFKKGKHYNDNTISPHTRKTTKYDDTFFDMGVCSIDFERLN